MNRCEIGLAGFRTERCKLGTSNVDFVFPTGILIRKGFKLVTHAVIIVQTSRTTGVSAAILSTTRLGERTTFSGVKITFDLPRSRLLEFFTSQAEPLDSLE